MALIYLYSHDGEGLGHLRRNLNIAEASLRGNPSVSAMLLTGSLFPGLFGLPERCDYVKMPTVRKTGPSSYEALLGNNSRGAIADVRASLLRTLVSQEPPDLLIVDKLATGLNGELLPTLRWLRKRSPKTRIVLGLRDILDDADVARREWMESHTEETLQRFYDLIWLYADENVFSAVEAYKFSAELKAKAKTVGYVVAKAPPPSMHHGEGPFVVAMVGGGSDGQPIIAATIDAAKSLRARWPNIHLRLFAGPMMPESDCQSLRAALAGARGLARIERFSDRALRHVASADATIIMGGYNSVAECVSLGRPTIVIPREFPRTEQLIRARAFESAGVVRTVRHAEVAAGGLSRVLAEVLSGDWAPRRDANIDFDGCRRVAKEIEAILGAREPRVAAPAGGQP